MSMGKAMLMYRHTQGDRNETERREYPPEYRDRTSRRYDETGMRYRSDDRRNEREPMEYDVRINPRNEYGNDYGNARNEYERTDNSDGEYRYSRQIGFGASATMGNGMQEREMREGYASGTRQPFGREIAEKWVREMHNEDKQHQRGGKWTPEMIRPLAQKFGVPDDGEKFWEFYAMTNAMYSDYCEVAKQFGIVSPEFYALMAKAWMNDRDANPDKTALYYDYIVKKG